MIRPRIIPCLLLKGHGFFKTKQFRDPVYLGDPVNIVRIFNDKEADEIAILDIGATLDSSTPKFDLLHQIATECFVPLAYGGGVRSVEDARTLFRAGFEKVCINTQAQENPDILKALADRFGSQSIVASIDVKKNWMGRYEVFTRSGTQGTGIGPVEAACKVVECGAGEILLTSIDRDGTYQGYDLELVQRVVAAVNVPIIASGGAAKAKDLVDVIQVAGAAAAAAGSLFVFHGPLHAVLINMPSTQKLNALVVEQKQEKKR